MYDPRQHHNADTYRRISPVPASMLNAPDATVEEMIDAAMDLAQEARASGKWDHYLSLLDAAGYYAREMERRRRSGVA